MLSLAVRRVARAPELAAPAGDDGSVFAADSEGLAMGLTAVGLIYSPWDNGQVLISIRRSP